MPEKDFIREYRIKYLKAHPEAFFYKLPDAYRTGLKPFDAFVLTEDGGFIALEFKWARSGNTFNTNCVLPHQKRALKKVKMLGHTAYVVLKSSTKIFHFDIDLVLKYKIIDLRESNVYQNKKTTKSYQG